MLDFLHVALGLYHHFQARKGNVVGVLVENKSGLDKNRQQLDEQAVGYALRAFHQFGLLILFILLVEYNDPPANQDGHRDPRLSIVLLESDPTQESTDPPLSFDPARR